MELLKDDREAWVAQCVKSQTLAEVTVSPFVNSSPSSGSSMTMQSLLEILSLSPLPLYPSCALSLSLSLKKTKQKTKTLKDGRVSWTFFPFLKRHSYLQTLHCLSPLLITIFFWSCCQQLYFDFPFIRLSCGMFHVAQYIISFIIIILN